MGGEEFRFGASTTGRIELPFTEMGVMGQWGGRSGVLLLNLFKFKISVVHLSGDVVGSLGERSERETDVGVVGMWMLFPVVRLDENSW